MTVAVSDAAWDRFVSKVDVGQPDECWEWLAGTFHFGYGQFKVNGQPVPAHRVAWELEYGLIPDELCVLHRCDNPPCCNPEHLFLGTQADNMRDMHSKGRHPGRKEDPSIVECPNGHPYSGTNLRRSPKGRRYCLECKRVKAREYYQSMKGQVI